MTGGRAACPGDRLAGEVAARALGLTGPLDGAMGRPGGLGPKLEPPPGTDAAGHPVAFAGRRA
jgi:hypothetical protein